MKIIDDKYICELLEKYANPDSNHINEIIEKAKEAKGVSLEDAAMLINANKEQDLEKLFDTAKEIKNKIYGKRVVLFTPLYVSNYCTNDCLYCGFRVNNKGMKRVSLTQNEITEEVIAILEQGHKRVLMLMGEHPKNASLDYFIECINTVYSAKDSKGNSIQRINVEIEPLSAEEFQKLKDIPIGTYTVFQETYNKKTYEQVHLSGIKTDYNWRLEVMHRALNNGLHDVGIGALFGLYDYRFEVLGLLSHAMNLDKEFNIGPHTISVPRLQYAHNAPLSAITKYAVSDIDFKKIIAVLRLAVPYTGMILSTRERAELRMELLDLGISQISSGSRTNPGGYKQAFNEVDSSQFNLNDGRTSGEIIENIIDLGYIPSFCTSCYRIGRVGEKFMQIAKKGDIKLFCQQNALTTLNEYLNDYANENVRKKGKQLIQNELKTTPTDKSLV
ncbi:MAG: [FeFe] hydrogenase H-cluster radical SAM maturase HydG [Bacteroidetes bacterium]|nr:[FeFe] hydrogenase H-cluster radical SAM maturase HydG [Bacteroidota bacterium]